MRAVKRGAPGLPVFKHAYCLLGSRYGALSSSDERHEKSLVIWVMDMG